MATSMVLDSAQVAARLAGARAHASSDHRAMLLEMNALFRAGRAPQQPLDGAYRGDLITTTVGRAIDVTTAGIGKLYMPWRGKAFDPATSSGINLFTTRSKPLIRPFDPAVYDGNPGFIHAYPFRTYVGPGIIDRDREVFKIDYDIPANPFGMIRRVLDELVEVAPGYYLGKAHLRVRSHWRTVAYFALEPSALSYGLTADS